MPAALAETVSDAGRPSTALPDPGETVSQGWLGVDAHVISIVL
jgi:hypothetical protein